MRGAISEKRPHLNDRTPIWYHARNDDLAGIREELAGGVDPRPVPELCAWHAMPELPDITVYLERLRPRIEGKVLQKVDLAGPFLLRSVDPPLAEFVGQPICRLRQLGKRIIWCFDDERFMVLHLMIAGRLHWKPPDAKLPGKVGLAAFRFPAER